MSTQTYDLMLLLDTSVEPEQRKKILADVEARIGSGGEVVGTHDWGVRATAYEIRHKGDAEYHLLQFRGGRDLLEALQHSLRITDGVARFRIIKLPPNAPAPPAPPAPLAAIAPRESEAGAEAAPPAPPAPEPVAAEEPAAAAEEPAAAAKEPAAAEESPADESPAPAA